MGRFTDWFKGALDTARSIGTNVSEFIGKSASIIRNIGNLISYLPIKIGDIGKTIDHFGGMVDSIIRILPGGICDKIEKYIEKVSGSSNIDSIVANMINAYGNKKSDPGDQS